jgi:hypothetical protein
MRTKFNKDGTSVLQIDIESTKPTRGIYEVDEIEEFTVNEAPSSNEADRRRESTSSNNSSSTSEFRQVIDINSVHTVKEPSERQQQQQQQQQQIQPNITNTIIDKKFVKIETTKTINAENLLKTARRIENIVDDDMSFDKNTRTITRINIDKNRQNGAKEIPEHMKTAVEPSEPRAQTLIIDDVDSRKPKVLNIDGQTHVYKNEVNINEQYQNKLDILNMTQKSVEELSRQLHELEQEKKQQKKEKFAEIVEKYGKNPTHLDLVDHAPESLSSVTRHVSHSIDIQSDAKPHMQRPVYDYSDERNLINLTRPVYEDTTHVHHHEEEEIVLITEEEEDETFDEWTEVYTIITTKN